MRSLHMGFQRLNKKGLEFKRAFHSLIVFSVIIICVGIVMGSWSSKYDSNLENDLGEFNFLDEVSEDVGVQRGKISTNDPDPGSDAEANTFRGVYGILANVISSFDTVVGRNGIINMATTRFGIPPFVAQFLIAMIVVAVVFALVGVIFRLGRPA